jgi:polyhydroxybutyrate depolymerase
MQQESLHMNKILVGILISLFISVINGCSDSGDGDNGGSAAVAGSGSVSQAGTGGSGNEWDIGGTSSPEIDSGRSGAAGDWSNASGGIGGNASGDSGENNRSGSGDGASPQDAGAVEASVEPDAAVGFDAGTEDTSINSTGPGDWGPGDYPPDISSPNFLEITGVPGQNGYTRQYKVHVPPSYDPSIPTPLVFCIHGLMQDALMFCVFGAQMHLKSDEAGFILVMPNGYQNSWNAGTCCGGASAEQLDDVALFRAILDEVGTHLNVDLGRVYATGLSNGGFMSFRLGCEAADLFAAVAPGAGSIGINDMAYGTNPVSDFTQCEPSETMPVLEIHGTADMLVPYSLQKPSLDHMAVRNGCSTTTTSASSPASGGDTTCVSYTDCPNNVEVIGCSIEGGGHCWFGSEDCGTGGGAIGLMVVGANSDTMVNNDAVWDFFKRHSR